MTRKESLGGVAETMLQTLYARAKESKKPNHKIYDAKAVEIVDQMDYDFGLAHRDLAMSAGVVARTIVLDRMVKEFLQANPTATVVNLACGMDTRFYRVDNGQIHWYNLDLPVTMEVRAAYLKEPERVVSLSASAMDPAWADQVETGGEPVLVIVEGLTMYLEEGDVKNILSIIAARFPRVTVYMEVLSPRFVKKKIEKSIQQSGAQFTFGVPGGQALAALAPAFRWVEDRSLVEGMVELLPVYRVLGKLSFVRNLSNKICVLQQGE